MNNTFLHPIYSLDILYNLINSTNIKLSMKKIETDES